MTPRPRSPTATAPPSARSRSARCASSRCSSARLARGRRRRAGRARPVAGAADAAPASAPTAGRRRKPLSIRAARPNLRTSTSPHRRTYALSSTMKNRHILLLTPRRSSHSRRGSRMRSHGLKDRVTHRPRGGGSAAARPLRGPRGVPAPSAAAPRCRPPRRPLRRRSRPAPASLRPARSARAARPRPGARRQGAGRHDQRSRSSRTPLEFEPRSPNYRSPSRLEDADLAELVRVIAQLTGKRFIFGGKVKNIKATVYSPQKVTVAEAYQAFLSILETNGLTVVPHGRFLKIVETAGSRTRARRSTAPRRARPPRTASSRACTASATSAPTTSRTCSASSSRKEADITVYGPGQPDHHHRHRARTSGA